MVMTSTAAAAHDAGKPEESKDDQLGQNAKNDHKLRNSSLERVPSNQGLNRSYLGAKEDQRQPETTWRRRGRRSWGRGR